MRNQGIAAFLVAASHFATTPIAYAETGDRTTADIVVTAAKLREAKLNESASATGLDLTLRETPQSVSVIDRERIGISRSPTSPTCSTRRWA